MTYNITIPGGTTKRLPTEGKYCDGDIIVTAEGGGTVNEYESGFAEGVRSVLTNTLTSYTNTTDTTVKGDTFRYSTNLQYVDFHSVTRLPTYIFNGCTGLNTLIIRTKTMCILDAVNCLSNSAIESGTGYIYVPAALIETYKAGKNWSSYASQFRAIEDYPEITGG